MKKQFFIFEDNPDMSVSRLISKHSFHGEFILFSNGNTGLLEKLESIYNSEDTFIIFYDISPENKVLISRYYSLLENIRMQIAGYNENVYVIPVICTEYHIVKMLLQFDYIDHNLDYVVDCLDYEKIQQVFRQRTLEKVYKQVIRSLDKAFHNINELEANNAEKVGKFYRSGDRKRKAEQFWFTLPLTSIVNEEHQKYLEDNGLIKQRESLDTVERERNTFFEDIFQKANAKSVHFRLRVAK